ncbi:hypothetical protein QJS10_CPB20g00470 [Acorus calamus]|uniref:Neprosin PEP catalytic domain-containing protein n=1 Tax=Acorus calamus TaxID=4465 RepID=A0AAV9CBH1_ACOCL|nr:hypothetical protein QJS10_CPB20g00470 [Acorus calamus]
MANTIKTIKNLKGCMTFLINRIKMIKSVDGDVIDCVNILKQPTFDHPLLQNHTIQGVTRPQIDSEVTKGHEADGYVNTGCYNLKCPGFVQVNHAIALGGTVTPISVFDGPQYKMTVSIFKDANTGNWWLQVEDDAIGYWPSSLVPGIADGAEMVQYGGEIFDVATEVGTAVAHTTTEMGSGHFPSEGERKASAGIADSDLSTHEDGAAVVPADGAPPSSVAVQLGVTTNVSSSDVSVPGPSSATGISIPPSSKGILPTPPVTNKEKEPTKVPKSGPILASRPKQNRVNVYSPEVNVVSKDWASLFTSSVTKQHHIGMQFFPPKKDYSQKFAVLEEEEIKEAEAAWGFILVGYVWGKRPVYTPFLQFIKKLWKSKGEIKLTLQGNGFFMVTFYLEEDLIHVLEGGPWSMDNRPFVIQKWNRNTLNGV